jgi:hypothetical protein
MYKIKQLKHYLIYAAVAILITIGVLFSANVHADFLQNRSLTISDSIISAGNASYVIGFNRPNTGMIGSFELEICSNDPLPESPCTVPGGFSFASSAISTQTGITDFSISPLSTSNKLIFSRTPDVAVSGYMSISLSGVANPSSKGSYYARIQTFVSDDATGVYADKGGLAFAITESFNITTEVPPFLYFCVAKDIPGLSCALAIGNFIDLGELSSSAANTGYSQMLIATNANNGFAISVIGTPPTSGNDVISAMPILDSSQPGNNQFGINLTANVTPGVGQLPAGPGTSVPNVSYNTPNFFKFVSGDALVNSNTTSDYRKFTVSYIVNRQISQNPGIYNTAILYVALANF